MPQPQKFSPGFRLSLLDIILLLDTLATILFFPTNLYLAIAFVVLHFFLFCNILRLSRFPELLWAFLFISLAIATTVFNLLSWPLTFASATTLTLLLTTLEVRRTSYHGILWQKLNPHLPEWWAAPT